MGFKETVLTYQFITSQLLREKICLKYIVTFGVAYLTISRSVHFLDYTWGSAPTIKTMS